MKACKIREEKIKYRIHEAKKLSPSQRIEESLMLSKLCQELKEALKKAKREKAF